VVLVCDQKYKIIGKKINLNIFFQKNFQTAVGGATPESTETTDTRTIAPLRPSSAEIGILSAKFSPEFTAEVIADS